ncbi:uncharacterized protein METZ01_LOCUS363343 [marine metagenome]|uniref:Uncharacterized protein n=1 Tax=marine metagenome TaxID=408172 RepID=A0A382SKT0_9ZZZZ
MFSVHFPPDSDEFPRFLEEFDKRPEIVHARGLLAGRGA